ncbi:hypothetical protein LEP1GSC072_4223 [Leptospira noguchii str. Bonito]|nr:hypothetical protein LEP1GSC072_4223 [Leptospira noguchii str. Bonito]
MLKPLEKYRLRQYKMIKKILLSSLIQFNFFLRKIIHIDHLLLYSFIRS